MQLVHSFICLVLVPARVEGFKEFTPLGVLLVVVPLHAQDLCSWISTGHIPCSRDLLPWLWFVVNVFLLLRTLCNAAVRRVATGRLLSASAVTRAPATLPDLDYDYGELEPAISGEIMKIHHTKHHQVYDI